MANLYPCCDDPACDLCYGSGIASDDNPAVAALCRFLDSLAAMPSPDCPLCHAQHTDREQCAPLTAPPPTL